jgi:hypothetical protein
MAVEILKAIPTVFKGIRLKSRLEGDIAFLINSMGYQWQYEPQSYLLENGTHYLPDFYVPELKLFIEGRGYESDKGESQINGFAKMIAQGEIGPDLVDRQQIPHDCGFAYSDIYNEYLDYLVIGPDKCTFYECTARFGINKSDDVALCECDKCRRWFFAGMSGSYQCRYCGRWDGDHHFTDMRWLFYLDVLRIGYRQTTVKEFIHELILAG